MSVFICKFFHDWTEWDAVKEARGKLQQTRYCKRCKQADIKLVEVRESLFS